MDKDYLGNYSINSVNFQLAPYGFYDGKNALLKKWKFKNSELSIFYNSYMHISGHVFGGYCSSPFASKKEPSYILVWDGGLSPQLFFTTGDAIETEYVNTLFPITGSIYNEFPERFEPFIKNAPNNGSAGKAMAYVALGKRSNKLISEWDKIYFQLISGFKQKLNLESHDLLEFNDINSFHFTKTLINDFALYAEDNGFSAPDIIANFHYFLENLLIKRLTESIKINGMKSKNLCFVGGSALNIKWNSKIRESKIIDYLWMPPFTNDSGSAIGAACCEMVFENKINSLEWNVYSEPVIRNI